MLKKIWFSAALALMGALPASAASPATGEQTSPVPYILMGIGLAALVAVVVLTMVSKKGKGTPPAPPTDIHEARQNDDQDPADPQP